MMSENSEKFLKCQILPGSERYSQSIRVFNGWVNYVPKFVYQPNSIQDIQDIIQLANKNKLTISVKNGGHSAYGQSISQGGILIDMSKFKKIEVSKGLEFVHVQGGVLSGELDLFLSKYNMAIPLGDCPNVGVSGIALGGGNGFLSRNYGLTCDCIESIDLITSNGNMISLSSKNEEELFSAMKGAGQNNFGVVTSITFRLIKLPPFVTIFNHFWPVKSAPFVMNKVTSLLEHFPKSLSLYMRMNHDYNDLPCIRIYGMHSGDEKEVQEISMELSSVPNSFRVESKQVTYYNAQQINVSSISPNNISFHWENGMIDERISQGFSEQMVECFLECPNQLGRINIDPLGGKISEVGFNKTAFQHRNSRHILSIIGLWTGDGENIPIKNWTKNCSNKLIKANSNSSYQNYAGLEYSAKKYFGSLTDHLIDLKKKWDPDYIFEGLISKINY